MEDAVGCPSMGEEAYLVYRFGAFWLDPTKRRLVRGGEPMSVTPKGLDTLILLVQNRGRVLEKDELMRTLWPESFVEESNLSQLIFLLRKILGDDRNGNSFIQTVPRRGYKFIATVQETDALALKNDLPAVSGTSLLDYWSRHSPFRSLQVFEPEDAWLFFGREAETEDLLARLGRAPVLVVVGNSGSGKSSLIRAGLIAALREKRSGREGSRDENWRIAVFRPSGTPFDYLAEILPSQLAPELELKEQAGFMADCRDKLPAGGDALRNAICTLTNAIPENANARVLLVADQFEETFTLTTNPEERRRYIDLLLKASRLDKPLPVHLVLVLRADFYAQCLEHTELARCLEANLYNVPRMTPERLREAIEKRLQLVAAHAEPGLIDSLLEDVGTEPGNLALLEHALGQLWEHGEGPGCTLTNQAYVEIGRLRGALGRHADAVYESFSAEEQKRLVQRIFLELVHVAEGAGVQDTRRRARKTELLSLGAAEDIEQLLARLASSRLIATGREGEEVYVEVAHEALIREWPRLRDWLTHDREELVLQRRLLQAAEEWEGLKQDAGALLRGARLAQAEEWLARTPGTLPLLRDFLQAGIAARDEAERNELATQKREVIRQKAAAVRLRWSSCALAVLLLAAAGAAWYTYRIQLSEKSRTLAWHAVETRSQDQGQALDFAIRGWRVAKTEEARLAVTKAFPQLVATLKHDDAVESVAFSPDGQRILTASDDHTAKLWRIEDGQLLVTLLGHTDKITSAHFSRDGQSIVTASNDHTARVWNAANGQLLAILQGHADVVWGPQFSPDSQRIVTASSDHTAMVWNAANGRLLATLQGHTDVVVHAQFSADGQRIVTASWDHTARLWNGVDYTLVTSLEGHSARVSCAEFSPDGKRVVTGSVDGTARVWDSADGRLRAILRHGGVVLDATFSPDGRRIATAGLDHLARVWNSTDGHLLATLQGHTSEIFHVTFSPDGRRILTHSADSTARVWNSVDGQLLATLDVPERLTIKFQGGHGEIPWDSAFSPDGRLVVAALGDNVARVWNIAAAGDAIGIFRSHGGAVFGATFSPDGLRIVTNSADNTARVWSSIDGRLLATLQGHLNDVYEATWSPDGQRIVTASGDKTARIWNSADGRLLATLTGHTDQVYRAQFSPEGQRIVTASGDHTARIWNGVDGRLLTVLRGHNDLVCRAQFSPDGRRIVTASWDHTARVWDTTDGRLLAILEGHSDGVRGARFSPDGQRIVTFSWDHTARVWNSADGRLLAILQGHTDRVWDARFSPDGQRIVTASRDNTARVWNGNNYTLLNTLVGHSAELTYADFSPDGQRIVTASTDGTARVWDSADGRVLETLRGHTQLVYIAAFSPDGQRIVTASWDQTARVWRVLTLDDIEHLLAK